MRNISVMGKKPFTIGFRLAGVMNIVWTDGMDESGISGRLDEMCASPETGMVIIEGSEFERIPERDRERFESLAMPVVIPFSESFRNETLRRKISQTIGIDLLG